MYPAFFQLELADKLGVLAHELGHLTKANKTMFGRLSGWDTQLRTGSLLRAEATANATAMRILQAGRPGMPMPQSI